jgi:hypothetical protein
MIPHHSFIVRCWRDASGMLRGWLIDALSQRSYPFASQEELVLKIIGLAPASEQAPESKAGNEQIPGG